MTPTFATWFAFISTVLRVSAQVCVPPTGVSALSITPITSFTATFAAFLLSNSQFKWIVFAGPTDWAIQHLLQVSLPQSLNHASWLSTLSVFAATDPDQVSSSAYLWVLVEPCLRT